MGLSVVGKKQELIDRLLEAQAITQQYGSGASVAAGDFVGPYDDDQDDGEWMEATYPDEIDNLVSAHVRSARAFIPGLKNVEADDLF